jgi:hypothetical protein
LPREFLFQSEIGCAAVSWETELIVNLISASSSDCTAAADDDSSEQAGKGTQLFSGRLAEPMGQ